MDENQPFFQSVRGALNHLYDPEYLAKSPLVKLFGLAGKYDPAAALQQCLIQAITALRPQGDSLLAARDQQAHDLLLYRYVQRLTQDDIAHQFGISERQLRRDHTRAGMVVAGVRTCISAAEDSVGTTIMAATDRITTTTSSSINVNPFFSWCCKVLFFIILTCFFPCRIQQTAPHTRCVCVDSGEQINSVSYVPVLWGLYDATSIES
jgi:hypothetical protein